MSASIASAADVVSESPPPDSDAGFSASGHRAFGSERLFSKLGLSVEQQQSVDSSIAASQIQMHEVRQRGIANHSKLLRTRPDDPNYASVVAEVAQSEAALASQRTNQEAELRTQLYGLLTPAQKTQLATLELERAAHLHLGGFGDGR